MYRPLSRRLDRCDRVIQKESGDPKAAICVRFQGRWVRHEYFTMHITFLTRKSALIYRRGLRQRVASLTLVCNGVFAIRAYGSKCWALHRAEQQRMHTTEMKMLRWIQGKTRKDRIRNEKFRSYAMVKPFTTYVTQKRLSWYGHVLRRDDTNVAKHVTTMTVGGKRPRGRPKLRWIDRVQSDLRHHQLDPKLAQDREAWRNAVMAIDPGQG